MRDKLSRAQAGAIADRIVDAETDRAALAVLAQFLEEYEAQDEDPEAPVWFRLIREAVEVRLKRRAGS